MLWMITDFNKTRDFLTAKKYICQALEMGTHKVSLRNKGVFSFKDVVKLAKEISAKYPQKEIFFHDMERESIPEHKHFHFPSRKFKEAYNLKNKCPEIKVALSTHSEKEFKDAFSNGVDYVFFSPVFRALSKENDNRERVEPVKIKNLYLLGGIDRMRGIKLIEEGYINLAGISLFYGDSSRKDIFELANLMKEKEDESINTN